jgi:hypothetical protein
MVQDIPPSFFPSGSLHREERKAEAVSDSVATCSTQQPLHLSETASVRKSPQRKPRLGCLADRCIVA